MINDSKFNNIRPYSDLESIEAIKRIAENPLLKDVVSFLKLDMEGFKKLLYSLRGVEDFQVKVMTKAIDEVLMKTSSALSYSGIENIPKDKSHLLLSNHRDIVLDSALIQYIFYMEDVSTVEIGVGDNLVTTTFLKDIIRSNRMVTVVRGGSIREIYTNSTLLSEYIRESVVPSLSSIWIAQANGRAKNGIDTTSQGLLKMLDMSGGKDFADNFKKLSIIPISLSYEYEPCDFFKSREVYFTREGEYVKKTGEDLKSIVTGVQQFKGQIHLSFGAPLTTQEIDHCAGLDKNEKFKALGLLLDEKIRGSYKLWSNNYIAYDILNKTDKYSSLYISDEKRKFEEYMNNGLSQVVEKEPNINMAEIRDIFLSIYSNPVAYKPA